MKFKLIYDFLKYQMLIIVSNYIIFMINLFLIKTWCFLNDFINSLLLFKFKKSFLNDIFTFMKCFLLNDKV
jgi:hypothetical protein